jgi:hypothetical protein
VPLCPKLQKEPQLAHEIAGHLLHQAYSNVRHIYEDQMEIIKFNGQIISNLLTVDTNSELYTLEVPAQGNQQCKGQAHKWCNGNDHPHSAQPRALSSPVSMIEVCGLLSHEIVADGTFGTHLSPHAPC